MKAMMIAAAALVLPGCAGMNQQFLAAAKPIPMFTMKCEGYVVQAGLPVPLGQRMEELDALCPLTGAKTVSLIQKNALRCEQGYCWADPGALVQQAPAAASGGTK